MGAACCKRENNNEIIATREDMLLEPGIQPKFITESKYDKTGLIKDKYSMNSYGSFNFGKEKTGKKLIARGREIRPKKVNKNIYNKVSRIPAMQKRAYGNTQNGTGMTEGHKFRKNNLQLAPVPDGENEECFGSDEAENDTELPTRGGHK